MDRRIIAPNRLDESEIRGILIQYLTADMRRIAGYIPPKMSVTPVTYSLPKPLVLVRNPPIFSMNVGWWDACVDYLREMGMEAVVQVTWKKRKQPDGTYKEIAILTNSIQLFVDGLRKYVRVIDDKHARGIP